MHENKSKLKSTKIYRSIIDKIVNKLVKQNI